MKIGKLHISLAEKGQNGLGMNYPDPEGRGIGISSASRSTSNFVAGLRPGTTGSDILSDPRVSRY